MFRWGFVLVGGIYLKPAANSQDSRSFWVRSIFNLQMIGNGTTRTSRSVKMDQAQTATYNGCYRSNVRKTSEERQCDVKKLMRGERNAWRMWRLHTRSPQVSSPSHSHIFHSGRQKRNCHRTKPRVPDDTASKHHFVILATDLLPNNFR